MRFAAPRPSRASAALVVIVSDFRGPLDWRKPLLEVTGRHDVLAVEIRDPREQELPDVGELWLVDPETGRSFVSTRAASALRQRFAAAAAEERTGVARVLSALGVRHGVLSTSGDWLRAFAAFLGRRAVSFERPLALIALLAIPALVALWRLQERRRAADAAALLGDGADPEPVAAPPGRRRLIPLGILLVGLAALIVGTRAPARERERAAQGGDDRARRRRLTLDDCDRRATDAARGGA